MADGVDIDLYADVEHEFSQDDSNGFTSADLYDDMVQPSARQSIRPANGLNRNNSLLIVVQTGLDFDDYK